MNNIIEHLTEVMINFIQASSAVLISPTRSLSAIASIVPQAIQYGIILAYVFYQFITIILQLLNMDIYIVITGIIHSISMLSMCITLAKYTSYLSKTSLQKEESIVGIDEKYMISIIFMCICYSVCIQGILCMFMPGLLTLSHKQLFVYVVEVVVMAVCLHPIHRVGYIIQYVNFVTYIFILHASEIYYIFLTQLLVN